jgi:hypothetical protein
VQRSEDVVGTPASAVAAVLAREEAAGLRTSECYLELSDRIRAMKLDLLDFLAAARRQNRSVVAYGAAAKGNTLLNYCGVRADLIDYVVDRNPHKQGMFLPGSRIPIRHPDAIADTQPDYVLILPWNLSEEITCQMANVLSWGGRFVLPVPSLTIIPPVATRVPELVPVPRLVESRRSPRPAVPHQSGI